MSGGPGPLSASWLEASRARHELERLDAAELEQTKAVHNEQVKIRATFLNLVGVGFIVTGIIAPFTSAGTSATGATLVNEPALALMAIWIILALILHYGASLVLRSLR